ncbi:hypothetical protein QF020_003493 [Pseudomonas frederiksbergensis]
MPITEKDRDILARTLWGGGRVEKVLPARSQWLGPVAVGMAVTCHSYRDLCF